MATAFPIDTNRRSFLKIAGVGGALMLFTPGVAFGASGAAEHKPGQLGLYLRISPDNSITIGTPTTEIGQGTNTSIPMLIAEELDVPFERVAVEMIMAPFTVNAEGRPEEQVFASGAGGSTAIWESYDGARQAGAVARHLLMKAAARQWNVPLAELTTEGGIVHHRASRRSMPYGLLAAAAAREEAPAEPLPLKLRAEHKIIGTPQKQKQALAIVTGQPLYGLDQKLDGMVHAVLLRSPYLDGTMKRIDDRAARAVPGVRDIIHMPRPALGSHFRNQYLGEAVAVIADTQWAALKARRALVVEWSPGPLRENSDATYAEAWKTLESGKTQVVRDTGAVVAAFDKAAKVVEARYEVPLVAHATMEPQNCIAHVVPGGRVKVIASTQQPVSVAMTAAAVAGVDPMMVDVIPVRSGGGFGRRLYNDPIVEAVFLAKRVGRPVKLTWTRECDMACDFYRPGGAHLLRAALDADGRLTGWVHRAASQSRSYRGGRPGATEADLWRSELFPDDHPGSLVPNYRVEYVPMTSAAPRGAWRAPSHTANAWVMQAFLDEVAAATGQDPLAYRLALLGPARELKYEHHGGPVFDTGRLAGVLRLAAEKAGWNGRTQLGAGKGRGIAGHFSFGSYVAHVVDVSTASDGSFTVDRVVSAVDCGIAVNPNGVAMQNEGAINDALSTALGQEITISDGQIQQANFDSYEMMRIDRAASRIETHIVPSDASPRGMGEPAMPPFTPALTNALFAATGKRIRKLPIREQLKA